MTFMEAVNAATEKAIETGMRQIVYRHGLAGWTWMER